MSETFARKLAIGGKKNTLGRAGEVVEEVLHDRLRLEELYACLFEPNPWLRMRAADSLEKVCRVHPEWLAPYIDRMLKDMADAQPSMQWHLAQMLAEVALTPAQNRAATEWLEKTLETTEADWIVSANAMSTLVRFAREGRIPKTEAVPFIRSQQTHRSTAVRKRAQKLLDVLEKENE